MPLPNGVEPILTEEDLILEGKSMSHCVASYAKAVRNGQSYIYRMFSPERATLEVKFSKTKKIIGVQLKGIRNSPPSAEAKKIILAWLTSRKKPLPDRGGG